MGAARAGGFAGRLHPGCAARERPKAGSAHPSTGMAGSTWPCISARAYEGLAARPHLRAYPARGSALPPARQEVRDTTQGGAIDPNSEAPVMLLLPPAPEGKPHPISPTELALHRLIQADEELRPLFVFNKTVVGLALLTAKVDLLWLEGRVAVEIDGSEHRATEPTGTADSSQDYISLSANSGLP